VCDAVITLLLLLSSPAHAEEACSPDAYENATLPPAQADRVERYLVVA
jgi:hypothetical protein